MSSYDHALTGAYGFRRGWLGRQILIVEESYVSLDIDFHERRVLWRDATEVDAIKLRAMGVLKG